MSEQQQHRCRPKRKAAIAALTAIQSTSSSSRRKDKNRILLGEKSKLFKMETLLFCDGSFAFSHDFFSMQILDYLPKQELVHHVSLVSKNWNHASKNPYLWTTLSTDIWKKNKGNVKIDHSNWNEYFLTNRQMFTLLKRPQFNNLKSFFPPILIETYSKEAANSISKLAKICPQLQELDISGVHNWGMIPTDEEIIQLPKLFPQLQKLHVSLRHSSQESLQDFAVCMGVRLVEFTVISQSDLCENGLDDDFLEVIAQHCPNLEVFVYKDYAKMKERYTLDILSEYGPIAILQNCKKLKKLEIRAPKQACDRIADFFQTSNIANRRAKIYLNFLLNITITDNDNSDVDSMDDDDDSNSDVDSMDDDGDSNDMYNGPTGYILYQDVDSDDDN